MTVEPPLCFYSFGQAAVATRREHTWTISPGDTGWTVRHCDDADQPLTPLEIGITDFDTAERFANTHLAAVTTPDQPEPLREVLTAMAGMVVFGAFFTLALSHLLGS